MPRPTAIHIFNPETDYALACGGNTYNPPGAIIALRRDMAYFPATYADDGDWIATFDEALPSSPHGRGYLDLANRRGVKMTTVARLANEIEASDSKAFELLPWGWNATLRTMLLKAGINGKWMKSEAEIERLRILSHRRTTIAFQDMLQKTLPGIEVPFATEIFSVEEAFQYLDEHGDAYFKMPWSSSGRGIAAASSMSREKLCQWIAGAIRRQGSILAEKAFDRILDFATEWESVNGKAYLIGYSVFKTSAGGRYGGNLEESQESLEKIISEAIACEISEVTEAQRIALEEIITPGYSGPLGIDMLASRDGIPHPCVEINLRQTMGMAALKAYYISKCSDYLKANNLGK